MTESRKMIHGSVSTGVRNAMDDALGEMAEDGYSHSGVEVRAADRIWGLIRDDIGTDDPPPHGFMTELGYIVGDSMRLWEESGKTCGERRDSLARGATLRALYLAAVTPELNAWINMTFFPMGCGWTPSNEDWEMIGLQWRGRGDAGSPRREAKRSVFVGVKRALEDIHEEWIRTGMATGRIEMIGFRNEAVKRIWEIVAVHLPYDESQGSSMEPGLQKMAQDARALIGEFVELHLRTARDVYVGSAEVSEEMLARLAKSNSRMGVSGPHNSIIRLIETARGLEPCTEIEEPRLKWAA